MYVTDAHDFALMWAAYEEAMTRELAALVNAIPADDLVIPWDKGARRRVQTAHQYRSDFGIAAECGFGRRPAETIPELLRMHREVASGLSGAD